MFIPLVFNFMEAFSFFWSIPKHFVLFSQLSAIFMTVSSLASVTFQEALMHM